MIPAAKDPVIQRRAAAPHTSMFLRMLLRAAVLRRGRAASALLAMVVAAAVATAMLNLYVDVQAKLRRNSATTARIWSWWRRTEQELPADALAAVESVLGQGSVAVPFAYVVARTTDGRSIVVAGTDFEQVRRLDRWWSVTAWPKASHDALVGTASGRSGLARTAVRAQLSGTNDSPESGRHRADGRCRRQPNLYLAG